MGFDGASLIINKFEVDTQITSTYNHVWYLCYWKGACFYEN